MPIITRETPDALNDRCRWFSSDSLVVKESPRESLFKDRYSVNGIGSGIAKRLKDPAQVPANSFNMQDPFLLSFPQFMLDHGFTFIHQFVALLKHLVDFLNIDVANLDEQGESFGQSRIGKLRTQLCYITSWLKILVEAIQFISSPWPREKAIPIHNTFIWMISMDWLILIFLLLGIY